MENALLLIGGIAAFGLLSVVVPVMLEAYFRYREDILVNCPRGNQPAELVLDPGRAAMGAAFGKPVLRVLSCSRWPLKEPCHDECVREKAAANKSS
jgi:hypothetical protein